jgi:hypothetical protein
MMVNTQDISDNPTKTSNELLDCDIVMLAVSQAGSSIPAPWR